MKLPSLMGPRALLLVAIAAALLGGWGGYRIGGARADRMARQTAESTARDNAAVYARQRALEAQQRQDLQDKLDAQQTATAVWMSAASRLGAQADALREDIHHAQLTAPRQAAAADGRCPGNPLDLPEFRRLYDRAAAGGAGAAAAPGDAAPTG
ncbi:MAG: hypothetical protein ABFC67_04800 [Mizugakiibacter sp.]|uniref:hypothetical protein n=1 Tax=Mizugakiibacter sp. TaxID=1972610 RepID=UPI00320EA7F2